MSASLAARQNILARLRSAPTQDIAAPAMSMAPAPASPEILLDQFRHAIEAFHAEIIDARQRTWRTVLTEVCTAKRIGTLMLPPTDLADLSPWPGAPQLSRFDRPLEAHKAELFDAIDAGLTIADGAIADTGTLIHADPRRMPRTLSLVPPIHICLLDAHRIYPSLQAALAAEQWRLAMPSNLIFISGPSKTADIQQTMAYGAHGPRELIVLLTAGL